MITQKYPSYQLLFILPFHSWELCSIMEASLEAAYTSVRLTPQNCMASLDR